MVTRRMALVVGLLAMLGVGRVEAQERAYRSPYRVAFSYPVEELIGDFQATERGDPRREASIPFRQWYEASTRARWHGWGPTARTYSVPAGVESWPIERQRERVIAVALRFQGYGYQHHHIPDWEPPLDWPWKPTCAGRPGKGVDCSNLTGFVYNQGFGLRLSTDVDRQAEQRTARAAGVRSVPLRLVSLPEAYDERVRILQTGDLVYIRNRGGTISHVVLWVGSIGRSPDGAPLVLDSHGEDVRDSEGRPIPCGVQLRPFRPNSWYNRSASHALRVFHE